MAKDDDIVTAIKLIIIVMNVTSEGTVCSQNLFAVIRWPDWGILRRNILEAEKYYCDKVSIMSIIVNLSYVMIWYIVGLQAIS